MAITNLVPWKRGKTVPVKAGVQTLHDEMNQLFDEFFSGFGLAPWAPFAEMRLAELEAAPGATSG